MSSLATTPTLPANKIPIPPCSTRCSRAKVGLPIDADENDPLIVELLELMGASEADFTLSFRRLCDAADGNDAPLRTQFAEPAGIDAWLAKWRERRGPSATDGAVLRQI